MPMLRNCLNHRYSLVPSPPIESDIQIKKNTPPESLSTGAFERPILDPTVGRRKNLL